MSVALKPLAQFLRIVPDRVHMHILSRLGSRLIKDQPICSRLDFLEGKHLQLSITDTGNSWHFVINRRHLLQVAPRQQAADVHIQGELKTFLLLATRNEDPDSLFFSRQLCIEGNTEDGLYIKNLLDAMDFDTRIGLQSLLGRTLAEKIYPLLLRNAILERLQKLGTRLLLQ